MSRTILLTSIALSTLPPPVVAQSHADFDHRLRVLRGNVRAGFAFTRDEFESVRRDHDVLRQQNDAQTARIEALEAEIASLRETAATRSELRNLKRRQRELGELVNELERASAALASERRTSTSLVDRTSSGAPRITRVRGDLAQIDLGHRMGIIENAVFAIHRRGRRVGELIVEVVDDNGAAGTVTGSRPRIGDQVSLLHDGTLKYTPRAPAMPRMPAMPRIPGLPPLNESCVRVEVRALPCGCCFEEIVHYGR